MLATLRFGEGSTQQELAKKLLVTKGNVCGVVQRLEALGWIQRKLDPNDARANRLALTASGRAKIDSVMPKHDETVMRALRKASRMELLQLRDLLSRLEGALD